MNKKVSAKTVALTGILTAIMFLLGLTPIGYIPIGPIQITLMCLPLIIGTIVCGLGTGLFLGLVFGFTSLIQALMGTSALLSPLFAGWPALSCVVIFVPRLVIPVVVHFVYKAFGQNRAKLGIGVAAAAGSLTNTVLFLLMLGALLGGPLTELISKLGLGSSAWPFILTVGAMNGLPEAAVAVIVCIPVVVALQKTMGREKKVKNIGE